MTEAGMKPAVDAPQIPIKSQKVSISYLFVEFHEDNEARLKQSTAQWYFYELKRFLDWLGKPALPAEDLTPHHLTKFCNSLTLTGGAGERNIKLAIKRAYRWGKEQKLIKENDRGQSKGSDLIHGDAPKEMNKARCVRHYATQRPSVAVAH